MTTVTLAELPAPSPGREGWPWTEASAPFPEKPPKGVSWPRITIVTPSYNQGRFIEETIRSVLLQGYPNLEYFIMDGGSTDETVDIIRKYDPWITYWVSEKDRGQTHAINKGWERSTGELITWLNSDDYYPPDALRHVGEAFAQNPHLAMAFGDSTVVNEQSAFMRLRDMSQFNQETLLFGHSMAQPAVFNHRRVMEEHGLLKEELYYVMDFEFFLRVWHFYEDDEIVYLPYSLANERRWSGRKTQTGNYGEEWLETVDNFFRAHAEKYIQQEDLIRKSYSSGYRQKAILQARCGQRMAAQYNAVRATMSYPGLIPRLRWITRLTLSIWFGKEVADEAGRLRRRLSETAG